MKESFELMIFAEKCVEDLLCGQCRCHWQITASQTLRQCHEIRLNVFVLAGKENWRLGNSSAAKTSHHFVSDQLCAMASCDLRDAIEPAARLRNHSSRALHQRFDNER